MFSIREIEKYKDFTIYAFMYGDMRIGKLKAKITAKQIKIYSVYLQRQFRGHYFFKRWVLSLNKKIIPINTNKNAKKYWKKLRKDYNEMQK